MAIVIMNYGDSMKERSLTEDMPAEARVKILYVYILAFFSGMCIMAVELAASRLVAPYFGTSTFVWTNIIGVIMIALSVGYIIGGRLADRRPQIEVLLKLLLLASLLLFAIPFVAPSLAGTIISVMKTFHSSFSFIFFGSLTTIALLFSLPVVIMGMTSPFLIRIIARGDRIGGSAGHIFGISTIGSIVGTFLPVLVFIPAFGTGKTILFFAALQCVVTLMGFAGWKYSLFSIVVIVPFLFPVPRPREVKGEIYSTESAYEYIEVRDHDPYRYLVYNDGIGFQTAMRKDNILTGFYYDYFSLLPYLLKRPAENALLIGLGGGIIANQLHYFHPRITIAAAEIDPKVIHVARKYFHLASTVKVFNQDGRIFETLGKNESYDIVIIDAYSRQLYIPFHLTTAEFFGQVKRTLTDQGIVAMNVAAFDNSSELIRSIANTLHRVFAHVYQIGIPNTFSNIVLASEEPIDFNSLVRSVGTKLQDIGTYTVGDAREIAYDGRYPSLTDDKAPVELMIDWELLGKNTGG
jgi:spermidine synthase